MKHLAGVLRQDSGEVLCDGEPVYENPGVKGRIFCIPDEVFHFPQASILDMMKFYRRIYPNFDPRRFEQLREVFDLDLKQPMRRFSRGMLKQAAFWLAISMRPGAHDPGRAWWTAGPSHAPPGLGAHHAGRGGVRHDGAHLLAQPARARGTSATGSA